MKSIPIFFKLKKILVEAKKNQQSIFVKPKKKFPFVEIWFLDDENLNQIQSQPLELCHATNEKSIIEKYIIMEESNKTLTCTISKREANDESETSSSSVYVFIGKKCVLNHNYKKHHKEKGEKCAQSIKYFGDSILDSYLAANFVYSRSAQKIFDPGGLMKSLANQLTDPIQPQMPSMMFKNLNKQNIIFILKRQL